MSIANCFPLDIESAQIYGIAQWHKEFFWPVSYKSFTQMETKIKQALNDLIEENNNNEMSELLLINYKFFFKYSNLLHSIWVLKELNRNGFKPVYGNNSVNFKGIIESGTPLRSRLAVPSVQRRNIFGRLRTKAKLIKAAPKLNRSTASLWKSLFCDTPFVANYSSLNNLAHEYIISKLDGCVALKDTDNWYPGSNNFKLTKNQEEEILALTAEIVHRIEKIADSQDLKLTESQLAYLHKITLEVFQATMICLSALKSHVTRLKPVQLLIGSSGNHFSRMLSVAVRDNGGSVTGFTHGEPIIYLWDKYSWLELSSVDSFITYTENSAKVLKSLGVAYPPLRDNQVNILGAGTKLYYNIWQRESRKPPPKKIERVMIVAKGFAAENRIGQGTSFPELMQLDCDLRIIDSLKRTGCKVIYKKHPDGKLYGLAIDFFDSDVEVVYDRFEDVMDYADAYVFYHTRSTTLGPALCTNKPIIYIDGGWETWVPEMRELFAQRCRIIPAHFDKRNQLIINEEELSDALARKPVEPNTEFIEKYMFPEGVKA